MKSILKNTRGWIADHQNDIILLIGVILISLLSFAAGYITGAWPERKQIQIEKIQAL